MGIKQKKSFFEKKTQNGRLKKMSFSTSAKAEQFLSKFYRLVLGIVGLIDGKGINVTQPIRPSGCLMKAQKKAKNTKKAVLALFWAI